MARRHTATPGRYVKLQSDFPRLIAELVPTVMAATKAGADMIEAGAKDRVPVDDGDLRDSIHTEFEGDADWSVNAGGGDIFYGHMVEYGTTRAGAHPFLVPSFEANRAQVVKLVSEALDRMR